MKQLSISLDSKSINNAIKQLKDYKTSLQSKTKELISRLIDEGIEVAEQNTGGYGKYIKFSKNVKGRYSVVGFLIAEDSSKIIAEWDYKGDKKTAELSPLLLSEFGSATMAEVLFDIAGVGQGTFPGQTHAFESRWWYKEWTEDGTGEWKLGHGVQPTHPMHEADMAMLQKVEEIAREVFNGI